MPTLYVKFSVLINNYARFLREFPLTEKITVLPPAKIARPGKGKF